MAQHLKSTLGRGRSVKETPIVEQSGCQQLRGLLTVLLAVFVLACNTPQEQTPAEEATREATPPAATETPDLTGAFTEGQLLEGATTLLEAGDLTGAEAFLTERLNRNPSDPAALHKLGFALLGQERYAEAIDVFNKELEVDSEFPDAWLGLALAFAGNGQRAQALDALDSALTLDPKNADALEALQALGGAP